MVTEPKVELTPAELMAKIAAAGASGDLAEVIRLGNQLKKHQVDIQKAEAEKLKAEAIALSGDREAAEKALWSLIGPAVKDSGIDFYHLKAKSFTVTVSHREKDGGVLDKDGTVKVSGAVKLTVPTIKTKAPGGGGGSTGLLKAQTGLSRHELMEQYGTLEEVAAADKAFNEATIRPDAARYSAEKSAIKRILAENPHLIKS